MEENLWLQTQTDGHHPQHTQRQLPTPLVERELSVLERRRGPMLGGRRRVHTISQDFWILSPMYYLRPSCHSVDVKGAYYIIMEGHRVECFF